MTEEVTQAQEEQVQLVLTGHRNMCTGNRYLFKARWF